VKAEGITGLYRGFGITLLRELPSFAGYFFIYEGSKRVLSGAQSKHESELTGFELLLCGGLAGFGAWLPCYPQDVIKSRIQSSQSKLRIFETAHSIMNEFGLRGFFRGFGPTMARAFPANAATFFAYEFVHKRLSKI
jgi:solute carrier family 25 carnitine/acylcarnitine transporter 20/29